MGVKDDLVVVPVGVENFNKMFMKGFWSAIEISETRLPYLQYIACYQIAPISSITYYARIDETKTKRNNRESHKYDFFFDELTMLSKPISMGKRQFGQGRRYTTFQRLLESDTLDDLFDFDESDQGSTQSSSTNLSVTQRYDKAGSGGWTFEKTERHLMQLVINGIFQVYYGDLYSLAGINSHDQTSRNEFNNLLGDISIRQHFKGLPLLSVLVVKKDSNLPGSGFFNLARDLNPIYASLDDKAIYTQEIDNLRRHSETYARLLQSGQKEESTYLLTWNPGKTNWMYFQEDWENVYVGNRPRLEWSCGNTHRIHVGDRVFMMRLGWNQKVTGILASGRVIRGAKAGPHWADNDRTALYIEFEPDVLLNPETDVLLNPNTVSEEFNWRPQSSGVTIPKEIAAHLEIVWQKHIGNINHIEPINEINEIGTKTYVEGSRKIVTSYRYERDPHARNACVQHYGTRCAVCDFEFGEAFGTIGEGFIHVHHLSPISEHDSEYNIDPINDLRPVCPNCHAMLHRENPPYSISKMKEIREQVAKQRNHSSQTKP